MFYVSFSMRMGFFSYSLIDVEMMRSCIDSLMINYCYLQMIRSILLLRIENKKQKKKKTRPLWFQIEMAAIRRFLKAFIIYIFLLYCTLLLSFNVQQSSDDLFRDLLISYIYVRLNCFYFFFFGRG